MSADQFILALDAIDAADPEKAHGEADEILLAYAPAQLREAHARLVARCDWWASA